MTPFLKVTGSSQEIEPRYSGFFGSCLSGYFFRLFIYSIIGLDLHDLLLLRILGRADRYTIFGDKTLSDLIAVHGGSLLYFF